MTDAEIVGSSIVSGTTPAATNADVPAAKRRKLTPSEKVAKAQEKEAKDRQKAEEKARKEEEKRVKDEEKRRKAEEREGKKREKDLAEQAREEAKKKKERSQMRLVAFFGAASATPAKALNGHDTENGTPGRHRSLSLERYDEVADHINKTASPSKHVTATTDAAPTPAKPTMSDYRKHFLPFELPSSTIMAHPYNVPNPDDLAYWQGDFDRELQDPAFQEKVDLGMVEPTAAVDHMFRIDRASTRGVATPNVRTLVDMIQGTVQRPNDLTEDGPMLQPLDALNTVSLRHIQFSEDVRPAYFGSYCKIRSPRTTRRLMLNPFSKSRTDTDYGYDSEAEWDEADEGEGGDDCGDDEDDDESVGSADGIDAFLDDDEDALKGKRKMITGDLQPTCTGICWENSSNIVSRSINGEAMLGTPPEMRGMILTVLLPSLSGQMIDPWSTAYWAHEMAPPDVPIADSTPSCNGQRKPLQERSSNSPLASQTLVGTAEGEKAPTATSAAPKAAKPGRKPQARVVSAEDWAEFKEAVVGSVVGKVELAKGLKAR
ncbi:hypothetical protein BAUCODRAFT_26328 [Baudoinia panamericana UAMH 10762]|uniref:Chromatin assembly factor 1 subunit A dimerization domain-containing protein n=1 Tax=Baudoinia panamericana (strain UAMH 10762) TaxID=717646 RepID=M2N5T5_BAUPA|nr:uncharacterized protein BAUCODRAFT_26328 [Baudoinia panamericana UAMH 10762]EMC94130.1 hypothetical protein BAUCODRAFT_26328 [Baudoinia panamericana UAMH 10762]